MKLSIIFLFSVLVVNSLFCDAATSPGCAYFGKRATAGYSSIIVNNQDSSLNASDFAKHHIIPMATIKEFFNLVLKDYNTQINVCEGISEIMRKLVSATAAEDKNLETMEKNFFVSLLQSRNEKGLKDMINRSQNPKALTGHIKQYFTWFPGNLFIGPSPVLREDDPGNEFEESARYIIGDTHHTILKLIHIQMVKYINTYKLPLTQDERYKMVNTVLELFYKLLPYPVTQFNPENWSTKWYIKKQFVTPKIQPAVPDQRRTRRQLKTNGCTFDDAYNSILSEVRKICISSDASCGCQLSKTKKG